MAITGVKYVKILFFFPRDRNRIKGLKTGLLTSIKPRLVKRKSGWGLGPGDLLVRRTENLVQKVLVNMISLN